jgi:SPX domain protein involved in polyphosphate accumulation
MFIEKYPMRVVNNIYFDTIDFSSYQSNIDGASNRSKVRIRWYNESCIPEIHNEMGFKSREYWLD